MKIGFNNLTCILPVKHGASRGADSIQLVFAIDSDLTVFQPGVVKTWPLTFLFAKIDENMSVPVDIVLEFNKNIQVSIWNFHGGNPDDREYLGYYTFTTEDTGIGNIDFKDPGYDSKYNLEYKYFNTEEIPYVRLLGVKCIKPATSIDADVISSITNAISGVATVFADSLKDVPDPRAKAASTALEAAAVVFDNVPAIAKAISEAAGDNDQLYITLGSVTSTDFKIYPASEYVEMNISSEIDLYEFDKNLEFPLVGTTAFSLWEKDVSSPSDWLGQIIIHTSEEVGIHMQTAWSRKEGSVYLVSYEILFK